MGLHGNGSRFTQGSHVILGAAHNAVMSRGNWNKPSSEPNRFMGTVDQKTAVPDGYGIGAGTWAPAIKTGGASTRYQIQGTASLSGAGAGGYAAAADLVGSGSLAALDTALALAVAALVGSGSLSGSAGASVEAQANLAGSGTLSAAASAVVNALADLAGSGGLTAFATALTSAQANLAGSGGIVANASAGFNALANLTGSGAVVPTGSAIAHAEANLTVGAPVDPLSPTALAAAVWNAFVAEFQAVGTFGEAIGQGSAGLTQQQIRDAMKLAPTAGVPASASIDDKLDALVGGMWAHVVEAGLSAEQLLRILAAVAAGKTTITDLGGGDTQVVFRGVGDTTDTVDGVVNDAGERTVVTYDP